MPRHARKDKNSSGGKTTRRKARHKFYKGNALSLKLPSISRATNWPVDECFISDDWHDTTQTCRVVVTRKSENGQVAVASFVVDLACLGVKNAKTKVYPSISLYRREYRRWLFTNYQIMPCNLSLAAKILDQAKTYAQENGFKPPYDYRRAMKLLVDADPTECTEEIPLGGPDGRPLYISRPQDNTQRIINTLNRTIGDGNYDYQTRHKTTTSSEPESH